MYEYTMVQIPRNIGVKASKHKGNEAAVYMERVVNDHTGDGWEFYRVDTINVSVVPGCLGGLFGKSVQSDSYNVISFRRQR